MNVHVAHGFIGELPTSNGRGKQNVIYLSVEHLFVCKRVGIERHAKHAVYLRRAAASVVFVGSRSEAAKYIAVSAFRTACFHLHIFRASSCIVGIRICVTGVLGLPRTLLDCSFPNNLLLCLVFFIQVRVPTFLVPATQKVYNDIQTLKVRLFSPCIPHTVVS